MMKVMIQVNMCKKKKYIFFKNPYLFWYLYIRNNFRNNILHKTVDV